MEDGAHRVKTRDALRMCACVCAHPRVCRVLDGFGARKKDEEYERGVSEEGKKGRKREREEIEIEGERDMAKQRPFPISILIELNATSYLMPETRQKLQLNSDAISLYLSVHSS